MLQSPFWALADGRKKRIGFLIARNGAFSKFYFFLSPGFILTLQPWHFSLDYMPVIIDYAVHPGFETSISFKAVLP